MHTTSRLSFNCYNMYKHFKMFLNQNNIMFFIVTAMCYIQQYIEVNRVGSELAAKSSELNTKTKELEAKKLEIMDSGLYINQLKEQLKSLEAERSDQLCENLSEMNGLKVYKAKAEWRIRELEWNLEAEYHNVNFFQTELSNTKEQVEHLRNERMLMQTEGLTSCSTRSNTIQGMGVNVCAVTLMHSSFVLLIYTGLQLKLSSSSSAIDYLVQYIEPRLLEYNMLLLE